MRFCGCSAIAVDVFSDNYKERRDLIYLMLLPETGIRAGPIQSESNDRLAQIREIAHTTRRSHLALNAIISRISFGGPRFERASQVKL